jgi:dTDP-4-amino-4,6-dideoxygalactose transaminase
MIEYENLGKLNCSFFPEVSEAIGKVVQKGWYVLGEEVLNFEKEFAQYVGVKHMIGVASGLDALVLSLKVLDLPSGSEVIVASNTYIATILAIIQAGCKPVLVEPDLTTYNINPKFIAAAITPRTRAIIPVHLYGKCCDITPIYELAMNYDLKIIEDCAQAHGAMFHGKKAGSFGHCNAFSFYPTKNLGAFGDAGAIATDDDELADKLLYFRNYGSKKKYHNKYIGYNSRLDEMQAAILRVKLKYLEEINNHKRWLAEIYFKTLDRTKFILPQVDVKFHDVYHIFCIRNHRRNELKQYLENEGIKTEIHYPIPPHFQEGYKHLWKQSFPISEDLHDTVLSLPISYFHKKEDIMTISEVVNQFH